MDIKLNTSVNNVLFYLPRPKSNFELVNIDYDNIKRTLYKGCIYLPHLLAQKDDLILFNLLNDELKLHDPKNLFNWSKHYKIENPQSNTFNKIVKVLSEYFNVNVLQTRINYYTKNDYKPFHHDSHAYTNGEKEDITIGCSFGSSRSLSFKHAKENVYFEFPQNNGDVFCFNHETNLMFMHGIPKIKTKNENNVRISIIIWGKKNKMYQKI